MSGQLLELIIFAGIAFFVIHKLLSVLGKTSDDDPSKKQASFFGENLSKNLKDVTSTGKTAEILRPKFLKVKKSNLKGMVTEKNQNDIEKSLIEVVEKMPKFNIEHFLNGAKLAFGMIIDALKQGNVDKLEELVDKRYIDEFKSKSQNYNETKQQNNVDSAVISEIYTFGNNVFIKVLFSSKSIVKNLQEEWTFSRSSISSDSTWYLNNVEEV